MKSVGGNKIYVIALIYWSRWTEESQNMLVDVRHSFWWLRSLMTVIHVHQQGLAWCYIAWCKVALGPHVRWCKCMYIEHLICCSWQVLLLELRLIPRDRDRLHVCGVRMSPAWPSTVQLNCSLALLTDPPCCHTQAKSRKSMIQTLGQGFSPVKEQNNNNKNPPMLLNTWVQMHIRHGCISLP